MASVSISCPSCSATDGVVRNGKSTAGHQRYLCSHCRKTGTVAKLAMRQPFVLFKGLTFQKLCLPGAFRPG
ncbi:IS1 family transposase, partial [Escherichia coli]|uniref:IS1 family transposase n=1 Tax=Escherichia coli TaxID=562 RepID=UPI00294FFBE0